MIFLDHQHLRMVNEYVIVLVCIIEGPLFKFKVIPKGYSH